MRIAYLTSPPIDPDTCGCDACYEARLKARGAVEPTDEYKPGSGYSSFGSKGLREDTAQVTPADLHDKDVVKSESQRRKDTPIYSGVMRYFPDALEAVARLSKKANDKHNPGEPLGWSRGKSNDHGDCIARHQLTPEAMDDETGELHATAVAWRALAQLQLLEEKRLGKGDYVVEEVKENPWINAIRPNGFTGCPVDMDTKVLVRLRNGATDSKPIKAGYYNWAECAAGTIVAYQVVG